MLGRMGERLIAAGLLIALGVAGCTGTTKTGRAYTFTVDRNVEAMIVSPHENVHATSERVLKEDLGYTIVRSDRDALEGIVEARTARGDSVVVETFKEGETTTRIQVFVGPMGDKSRGVTILERIEQAL